MGSFVDKFRPNGVWHTWIDYSRFDELMRRYYQTRGSAGSPVTFSSADYMCPTPEWALYKSVEKGFDPLESRWKRQQEKGSHDDGEARLLEDSAVDSNESGCG